MLNKKAIKCVVFFGILFGGCFQGAKIQPTTSALESKVPSFMFDGSLLPVEGAIFISDDFMRKMPLLTSYEPDLWPWFFKRSLAPVFEKTEVIKTIVDVKSSKNIKVIVKPEIWGFYFQSYYGNWICWLEFRYKILDINGNLITSISADGRGSHSDDLQALAFVMSEINEKLYKGFKTKKSEILAKLQ